MSGIQAVAPAFGVSVQVRDTEVRVQASDSGGRNRPHFAVLVSVRRNGDKLQLIGNPEAGQDEQRLLSKGLMLLDVKGQAESPYVFEIKRTDWPEAEMLLLLLVYTQVRGIGGTTRPRKKMWPPISFVGNHLEPTVNAVKQTLEADTVKELRSGLIHGKLPSSSRKSSAQARGVTFAIASCHFPSDFLDYMPDDEHAARGPADASLLRLGDLLGNNDRPTLLLLAGDQVYVDATAGLFDPKTKDDLFRRPYERRGQSRGATAVMQRVDLQVETMIDDHEIRDNWEPNDPATLLRNGKQGYFIFQRALRTPFPDHAWRCIDHQGIPFFLGDTRTERQGRTALNWRSAQIMSTPQLSELHRWMTATDNAAFPKFVLTPSAFLPRRLNVAGDPACALHSDAWDGYPCSQHALLKFACDKEVKGLVFLSGDEHICSFTEAKVTCKGTNKSCRLCSIHSSGLYAPYPFGNAKTDDFPSTDDFQFPDPKTGPYSCEVKTYFVDKRDGFALVTVLPQGRAWELQVTFYCAEGVKPGRQSTATLQF